MNWPFARRPGGASRQAAALAAIVVIVNCGGADGPQNPSSPSPPASPSPGGVVAGAYLLEVRPGPACAMGGPLTFPMTAVAAGVAPYPGVQVLVVGDARLLELEFRSAANVLTGGLGTTEQGILANEAVRMWMHAIGTGPVTRATDGRGQIVAGQLAGYVAFGLASGPEGSLGSCDSLAHTFALRAR